MGLFSGTTGGRSAAAASENFFLLCPDFVGPAAGQERAGQAERGKTRRPYDVDLVPFARFGFGLKNCR